jgi:hypothetical protein
VLAYLNWRFVEGPFRDRVCIRTRSLLANIAIAGSLVVAFFWADRRTDGFQYRFNRDAFIVSDVGIAKNKCVGKKHRDPANACGYGTGEPTVAIIGDWHARSLVKVLGYALGERGAFVLDLHVAGCVPVRNFLRMYTGNRCRRQDRVLDHLLKTESLRYVVIAVRWATKFEVTRFDNKEGGVEHGDPTILYPDTSRAGARANLADSLAASIRELLDVGKTVILIYPIPEVGWYVPNHLAKLRMRGQLQGDVSTSYDVFRPRTMGAVAALDAVGKHSKLHRVYPEKIFCNSRLQGRCMASQDLKAMYNDDNHVSAWGAAMVVQRIGAKIGGIARAQDGVRKAPLTKASQTSPN